MQFNQIKSDQFIRVQNAISGKVVQEDPTRETLVLVANASDAGHWLYDAKTKLLKNKASGRCLGRWQVRLLYLNPASLRQTCFVKLQRFLIEGLRW